MTDSQSNNRRHDDNAQPDFPNYRFPDGTTMVHVHGGAFLTNSRGEMIIYTSNPKGTHLLPNILRVQIDSMAEIEKHEIALGEGETEHRLTFRGGGLLRCNVFKGKEPMAVLLHNLSYALNAELNDLCVQTTLNTRPMLLDNSTMLLCLSEVYTHSIYEYAGLTTHLVEYWYGTEEEYAYNARGQLLVHDFRSSRYPPRDRDGNPLPKRRR